RGAWKVQRGAGRRLLFGPVRKDKRTKYLQYSKSASASAQTTESGAPVLYGPCPAREQVREDKRTNIFVYPKSASASAQAKDTAAQAK
ncbi:MAG: hypothetical protein J6V24_08330, partial [Clostridia bacterium]|nr:hypothetical protein [Clostridia bacterium]